MVLAEDIGDEVGRGERDVAEGLLHAEGVYQKQDLNVGKQGGDDRHDIHARFAEQAVGDKDAAVDQNNRADKQDLVWHKELLLGTKKGALRARARSFVLGQDGYELSVMW